MMGFNLWDRGLVARKCTPHFEPCWYLSLLGCKVGPIFSIHFPNECSYSISPFYFPLFPYFTLCISLQISQSDIDRLMKNSWKLMSILSNFPTKKSIGHWLPIHFPGKAPGCSTRSTPALASLAFSKLAATSGGWAEWGGGGETTWRWREKTRLWGCDVMRNCNRNRTCNM